MQRFSIMSTMSWNMRGVHERADKEFLDGEIGVCTDVNVAVPKRGDRGPDDEGGVAEYSDMAQDVTDGVFGAYTSG